MDERPTTRLRCVRPFSFFFDLVAGIWRSRDSDPLPLRRICTLARKQGVTFAIVESVIARPDIKQDIDGINRACGGGGRAEAVAVSFFASPDADAELSGIPDADFLGQVVVVNYEHDDRNRGIVTYVFEAILGSPRLMGAGAPSTLAPSYSIRERAFTCDVGRRVFHLTGTYFCQQNQITHACAQASLRMAVNTAGRSPALSNQEIDLFVGLHDSKSGLTIDQIKTAMEEFSGFEAEVVQCDKAVDYLRVLASVVESGDMALLVFTTHKPDVEHVVVVLGHAHSSGEWHPQGLPAYGRKSSKNFYSSSEWISHFVIHDDVLGPYYSLNARAFELTQNQQTRAQWIVAMRPKRSSLGAAQAEAYGVLALKNANGLLQDGTPGRWLDMMRGKRPGYILRPILLSRDRYLEHLRASVAHDGSRSEAGEFDLLAGLPPDLWMVEYTLPQLFDGNRSKLGEVVIDASSDFAAASIAVDALEMTPALAGLRAPGLLAVREAGGKLLSISSSISSHIPTYRFRN